MLLTPKKGVTYGPVRSRRLGASLGINVLPPGAKACTFDCLYCQYGWTDRPLLERLTTPGFSRDVPAGAGLPRAAAPADGGGAPGISFPSVEEVLDGVEAALAGCATPPAYLTFSGNGEPTLHPRFPELVGGVIRLRGRLAPSARTAVLSNSSRTGDPTVRDALARLDVRIMKLDAGTDETLRRYNRPVRDVSIEEIVEGLRKLAG